jgi:large subunit ribosomal protein L54
MICRTCLRQAASIGRRQPISTLRTFSTSISLRNAAQASAAAAPELTTPTGEDPSAPAAAGKPALSICTEGTVLNGLNYFKNKNDPVALADDQYPEWLWRCLEVQKKDSEEADDEAGDAFCTSPIHIIPRHLDLSLVLTNGVQPNPRNSDDYSPSANVSSRPIY